MNALMLMLAVRLGGERIRLLRVLPGALAGAAIAALARGLTRVQSMLVWLPAAALMMRIAQGRQARRHAITGALLLLCAAGFTGGMVLSLWGATGSLPMAYVLGGIMAAGVGACAQRARRRALDAARVRVICTYRGKSAVFDAMIDSGNTLRDYLTYLPVIVLPEKAGRSALEIEETPLRPIFAQTAGGRQRMYVLMPDAIALEIDGRQSGVQAVLALSPQMSVSVPALVPAALDGGNWNSNRGG